VSDIPSGFVPARFSPGFLDHAGPYYLKEQQGKFMVGCRVSTHHMNYVDTAHGGVLTTLADVALSWAVYNSEVPNRAVSTVSLTTNFLSGVRLGDWIEGAAIIDRIGKNLAYVHGAISCGDRVVMTMSGVFKLIRSKAE
jgi:acyl-coenzyme A thioesterase 13